MTTFAVSTSSEATVDADRAQVWEALTDHDLLPRLTPYLRRIDATTGPDGVLWTWHLMRIPVLGSVVSPSFTEVMTFEEPARIHFAHDPRRNDEHAGVEGRYDLSMTEGSGPGGTGGPGGPGGSGSTGEAGRTHLAIAMQISVDLPFPRLARPAVHTAMRAVVATMGTRFSRNLVRHLESHR